MYCYKLNDSYTVYVNYFYLNECIKASKKKNKPITVNNGYVYENKLTKKQKSTAKSLADNTILVHKSWGAGKVLSTDKKGVMTVEFKQKIARFQYPDAIKQGYLTFA